MPCAGYAETAGGFSGSAEGGDCPCGGVELLLGSSLHDPHYSKNFCRSNNFCRFECNNVQGKLAPMSIHKAIKQRMAAMEMTPTSLARRISELEPEHKVSRQTVVHWVRGLAAPKRERLPVVAQALGTTVQELLDLPPADPQLKPGTLEVIEALEAVQDARLQYKLTVQIAGLLRSDPAALHRRLLPSAAPTAEPEPDQQMQPAQSLARSSSARRSATTPKGQAGQ